MTIKDQFVHLSTLTIYEANYLMNVDEKKEVQQLNEEQLLERFLFVKKVEQKDLISLNGAPEYQDI